MRLSLSPSLSGKAPAACPTISAGRWQGAKDLRGISTVSGKGNGQGGSHVQRKYPGIDFHRARILMPGQRLDDLPELPVIKHVHDIAVPEGMRRHGDRKMHAISFSQLRIVSSVTGHNGSRRRGGWRPSSFPSDAQNCHPSAAPGALYLLAAARGAPALSPKAP